jgi:hypothetical protein
MDAKGYEIFIARMIERLINTEFVDPPSVKHLQKYSGKSGEIYEIDISYKFRIAEADYLTIVECKHWNKRVGRDVVAAFKTVLDDIGAQKGIIVTTVGFQSGALGLATKMGIALFKVADQRNAQLHAVSHFEGPARDVLRYLEAETEPFEGGALNEAVGFVSPSTHVIDYIYEQYGAEAADFFYQEFDDLDGDSKPLSLFEIPESSFKAALIHQLEMMPDDWVLLYDKIERCGLNLVFPPMYFMKLRILNLQMHSVRADLIYEKMLNYLRRSVSHQSVDSTGFGRAELVEFRGRIIEQLQGLDLQILQSGKELVVHPPDAHRQDFTAAIVDFWRGEAAYQRELVRIRRYFEKHGTRVAIVQLFPLHALLPQSADVIAKVTCQDEVAWRILGRIESKDSIEMRFQMSAERTHKLTVILLPVRG